MKNITLALLCCSSFLVACDNSDGGKDSSLMESAKESAGSAIDVAKETATEAISSGEGLKEAAAESTSAAVESVKETVVAAVTTSDNGEGESTYNRSCAACHNAGVAGSPKLGDQAAWGSRITQGNAVLTQHAIEGYKGKTGYMPPKGGNMGLSDEAISMTVLYMVSKVQ